MLGTTAAAHQDAAPDRGAEMGLPTVFDLCTPRDDVLDGTITDSDFAANLARVLRGDRGIPVRGHCERA
jgi:hypothetical protein